jgi:hypothetical protein
MCAAAVGLVICFGGVAGAAPPTTQSAPTVATDRSIAQAINLTSADLPGWTVSPNPPTPGNLSLSSKIAACAGGPSPQSIDVVDVSSANFDKGPIELNSDVTMVKTHNDGLSDLRASTSHKALTCFNRIFPAFLRQEIPQAKLSNEKFNFFTPGEALRPEFGISFAMKVAVKAQSGRTETLNLSGREIGFLVGSAEVTFGESFTGSPRPVSNEVSLVHLLYQRALQAQPS